MDIKEFKENLAEVIGQFHEYQLLHNVPYNYDTIGLQEWLLFNNGLDMNRFNKSEREE